MELLAEITRNGQVECQHFGCLILVDAKGKTLFSMGDTTQEFYMRSAVKSFQLMPLIEDELYEKYHFTDKEIAIMMASHTGEERHVQAVSEILRKIDLQKEMLGCGIHNPISEKAYKALLMAGGKSTSLHCNCSGKHAGMLALCRFHNWDFATYLRIEHPLQQRILKGISQYSELSIDSIHVGIDGCSAPAICLPVYNMALMYAHLAKENTPVKTKIIQVMTENPEMISGRNELDSLLMEITKGRIFSKSGAEGIQCFGIRGKNPKGFALKIADGAKRPIAIIVLALLHKLQLITESEFLKISQCIESDIQTNLKIKVGEIKSVII